MLEKDFKDLIQQNALIKIHENLYLTNYQREVLDKYQIPYQNVCSNKELLFYLSDVLDDDLEEIAREIADSCLLSSNK